jgi:hypothetical protein
VAVAQSPAFRAFNVRDRARAVLMLRIAFPKFAHACASEGACPYCWPPMLEQFTVFPMRLQFVMVPSELMQFTVEPIFMQLVNCASAGVVSIRDAAMAKLVRILPSVAGAFNAPRLRGS